MHRRPPRPLIAILVLAVLLGIGGWYLAQAPAAAQGPLTASGTIEATAVTVGPEVAGRVAEVLVAQGDSVPRGAPLVRLDDALLRAQRAQAAAGVRAAAAGVDAALAAADAAPAEVRRADAAVATAEAAVTSAQAGLDGARARLDLAPAGTPSAQKAALRAAVRAARAGVTAANAQLAAARAGQGSAASAADAAAARVEAARAAQAQAEAGLGVVDAQLGKLVLAAPTGGTVLVRAVEPGEVVTPGAALLEIADLAHLTLTVYVAEDRYGTIALGQAVAITVDAYPGETFAGSVGRIADRAEFTPRNVQTVDGRKSTVFAIELALDPAGGRLKPGMPADVTFR